jgi:hypothetical protein
MPKTLGLERHEFYVRYLKLGLRAGALYDFAFAAVMLVAPGLPESLLGLRQPGDSYFLWLMAIFLCMLGSAYLCAAYDPRAYAGIIWIAILGRFLGFVAMTAAAMTDPSLRGLYVLAFGDLFFAVIHALFFFPIRKR